MTKKKIYIIVVSILLLIITSYTIIASIIYSKSKNAFALGTTINDIDVSLKTPDEVKTILEENTNFQIIEDKLIIDKNDGCINIEVLPDDLNSIQIGNNVSFFRLKNERNLTVYPIIRIDENMLKKVLKTKVERKLPVDSTYILNDNNFIQIEAIDGNSLNYDMLISNITKAINNKKTEYILTNEDYLSADHTDYSDVCKKYNDFLNNDLTINLYSAQKEVIDKNVIINWVEKDSNNDFIEDENGNFKLNQEEISNYISLLKEKYDTLGDSQEFVTSNGEKITVDTNCWGWEINEEGTKEKILNGLLSEEISEIEPVYNITANNSSLNTIGDTYIEVDIENQHVWFHKDGAIVWETDCVTGDVSKHRDTPKGLYYILEKMDGKYLRGADYVTWVNKWMRVTWDGIGFHDATWRSSSEFGGDTYLKDGSHGCINLPYDKASELYNLISVHDPVIIY